MSALEPLLLHVSLVIATHDRPHLLQRLLNAVGDGDALPREVVIVD